MSRTIGTLLPIVWLSSPPISSPISPPLFWPSPSGSGLKSNDVSVISSVSPVQNKFKTHHELHHKIKNSNNKLVPKIQNEIVRDLVSQMFFFDRKFQKTKLLVKKLPVYAWCWADGFWVCKYFLSISAHIYQHQFAVWDILFQGSWEIGLLSMSVMWMLRWKRGL